MPPALRDQYKKILQEDLEKQLIPKSKVQDYMSKFDDLVEKGIRDQIEKADLTREEKKKQADNIEEIKKAMLAEGFLSVK